MKTIVVLDMAHSGTTMLAGILHLLGVPMWLKVYDPTKLECLEVQSAVNNEQWFMAYARARNEEQETWGFKMCGAWRYGRLFKNHLDNPIYFVIYKDPVTVSKRRFNKDVITRFMLRGTLNQMIESIQGIYDEGLPVNILSYQDAVLKPQWFVNHILSIIRINPPENAIDNAMSFIQPNLGSQDNPYPELRSVNHA